MGTTHVAHVTQPQVGRTGLEPSCAMFVSSESSRFLAGCTCMCLGIQAVCDWKWRAGSPWTRHVLCQPGLLTQLLFVLKSHRLLLWT